MRTLAQERQLNCTSNPTPVGLGEGAHASLPANVNLSGSPQRLRPVADKMPVGPTAKMAVPRPESFSTVRWFTGLTSDERIPILETKNSSMTSVPVRSTFAAMDRIDGRTSDQLRPVAFDLGVAPYASGSVLVTMGNTRVICGVTIEENVPRWMKEQGVSGGWLTAEYSMLPYSTQTRKPRDVARGRLDGRSVEIQRLIGRSLRAVIDLEKLGPRTVWVDCDVLQADGGTRTTAITGASLALAIACRKLGREKKLDAPPMQKLVAAVSAGVLDGQAILDLNYEEDKLVTVDFNLVATEDGEFVEVQASGEEATFANSQLDEMLALARKGIAALIGAQRAVLARIMVSPPEPG